jgi:hypothetical protein
MMMMMMVMDDDDTIETSDKNGWSTAQHEQQSEHQ